MMLLIKYLLKKDSNKANEIAKWLGDEAEHKANVEVADDQLSLAIGKGGQNVRLAAKLTGWRIDIQSVKGENIGSASGDAKEIEADAGFKPLDLNNDLKNFNEQ